MPLAPDAAVPLAFFRSAPAEAGPPAGRVKVRPDARIKKPFTRRRGDRSQQIRALVQIGFAAIAFWVGTQFYLWVRYYETGGRGLRVARPDGVEAWLPIASLMNLKVLLLTRSVPPTHAAGMFMLIAFLAISFLYRKAFCGWICPIGTISEWLWQGGVALFGRTLTVPRWLDVALRSLKYILLALFLSVVISMTVADIRAFLESPYGIVADVKMLDFFRRMGQTTAIVLALLVLLSVGIKNVWCRYLCPYGALMGLVALASPMRIRRDADVCIDCEKCAKACPAGLPVDRLLSVRSAECTACLSCVAVCPAAGALDLTAGLKHVHAPVPAWVLAAGVVLAFAGVYGIAVLSGHWQTSLPDAVYFDLIPHAGTFAHPR